MYVLKTYKADVIKYDIKCHIYILRPIYFIPYKF